MSKHNIILVTWSESSKAFQVFSDLRKSGLANINLAAIVERNKSGALDIKEQLNNDYGSNALTGGMVGSLIGILGGPLGILLGFSSGMLLGSLADDGELIADNNVLTKISQVIPVGTTALIIDLTEENEETADNFFQLQQGTVLRWDYEVVEAEVEASLEALQEAQRIARVTLSEQKKAENKQKRKAKWETFKAKFSKES